LSADVDAPFVGTLLTLPSLTQSAGTFILGLSWLIGTTAQEILASIIFLFIKHAYDVGDRVSIDSVDYIVLEMHLLSTIFKKIDGTVTQAPHSLLNTKFVLKCVSSFVFGEREVLTTISSRSYRRSGAIFESFTWDVAFDTPFEKVRSLSSLSFLPRRPSFLPPPSPSISVPIPPAIPLV
jgi:hypothetical protein